MASSIAAITTGSGGIVSTGDSSGNLNLVSDTTTIVAVTSAGVSVTGTLTASGTTTLASPVLSGTVTGTYTLGGTPTLTAPALGTPASGVLTNCTGISVASLSTASGSAPSYSARAWVNFNGTGTVAIRGSGNVSSITDNGTGYYTMNFTTAMPDANYVCTFASYGRQAGGAYNGTYELGYYSNSTLAAASKGTTSVLLGGCWGALNSFAQEDIEVFEVAVFR